MRDVDALVAERAGRMLDAIYDDVDHRLNPSGEGCWHCGGEGETSECFEEFACIDPEGGCADCRRPCPECRLYAADRAKAVREEVIKMADVDVAIAWLKAVGRWNSGVTREQVEKEIAIARTALGKEDVSD
jgi:hypothetical protein